MSVPEEDLQTIAGLLATAYLRLRERRRRATESADPQLACAPPSSPHGHEVNGLEKGERGDGNAAERD